MSSHRRRNPGPPGGYRVIRFCHNVLPGFLFQKLLGCGSAIAVLLMPAQRRHSRDYLRLSLGREPSFRDVWLHFQSFTDALLQRLLQGGNARVLDPEGEGDEFLSLVHLGAQVLYGTFHIGCSDIIGFLLGSGPRRVHMVRLKVGNSHDTERMMQSYAGVHLIWVNEPREMLFGIKQALEGGSSLAIQCDRSEFASKTAVFTFFGQKRCFPVTIYHLAALYSLPVAFCFSFLEEDETISSYACPVFYPPNGSKQMVLDAGVKHFQSVLQDVERLLKRHPYQWFNFQPLAQPNTGRGM